VGQDNTCGLEGLGHLGHGLGEVLPGQNTLKAVARSRGNAGGLFPEAARTESGYRQYTAKEVSTLRFIRQSRDLGFSIEQIRALLGLWQDRKRPSRQVRALAQAHIEELDDKLKELHAVKATLEHLVHCCHGDERPDCPIIDTLAHEGAAPAATAHHALSRTVGLQPGRARRRAI
jgi:MerR family copper efflux transcriptional regulator